MGALKKPSFFFSVLVAAFIAIAGATAGNKIQDLISQGLSNGSSGVYVILIIGIMLLVLMMYRLIKLVEDLHAKNRLSVRYYSLSDPNGAERVYDESRKFIEEAKEDGSSSIIAVNSFIEMFAESESHQAEKERRAYFEAIEKKIGRVDYQRLLQLNYEHLEEDGLSRRIAPSYREHFINIIAKRDRSGSNRMISLDRVPAKYPTSFVVITNRNENSYLIWQVNEHVFVDNELTEAIKLRGVFLIVDPDEQIIKHFKSWFSEINNNGRKKAIEKDDLQIRTSTLSPINQKMMIKQTIQRFYQCVDDSNWNEVLKLFSPSISYKRGSRLISGHSALERFYKRERGIQTGKHQVEVTIAPPRAYVSGSFRGKLVAGGEWVDVEFEDIFEFENEKIVKRVTAFHGREI